MNAVGDQGAELRAEQAYVDRAQACLEATRQRVREFWERVTHGSGGTHSARFERDVLEHRVFQRLGQLELGGRSLCFGRIEVAPPSDGGDGETFYIGRIGVWDEDQSSVVCDWRAPVAEPFYRATGRQPLGLARRRRFVSRGSRLLGLDDEEFSPAGMPAAGAADDVAGGADAAPGAGGPAGGQALQAVLDEPRTGRLGEATATIQAEQDDVIRAPLPGVLITQGGPGTGKTVVALHRAAYLVYTHRFPLAGQGVLVVGPNPVFLTYVEQVLPSLGEAGVELVTLGDLVGDVVVAGHDTEPVARTKGDARMAEVLRRAVQTRRRRLRQPLVVDHGLQRLRLSTEASAGIVARAGRRARTHNAGRRMVASAVYEALSASVRRPPGAADLAEALGETLELRRALDRMWPALTPAHLLHDLFGSRALLQAAGAGVLSTTEIEGLWRPRRAHADAVTWTADDAPLLDEARKLLGPRTPRDTAGALPRRYGHIVVDEAQDLSPMQLRMLGRRSLNGSLTLVGDIAQATGAWAHESWDEVVELLAPATPPRFAELSIGYRLPQPIMDFAAACHTGAMAQLVPPRAVRAGGDAPRLVRVGGGPGELAAALAGCVRGELAEVGAGNLAVICAGAQAEEISEALAAAGVAHGRAAQRALGMQVSVVPARLVKGLEVDAAVVVEPQRIVAESESGMRLLYVALTRATKRLSVITSEPLPPALEDAAAALCG